MPHSQYYIAKLEDITANQSTLGQVTYMPTDAAFQGAFEPDTEMVMCSLSNSSASLPDTFVVLPDPLRNKVIQPEVVAKLTSYGIQPSHTTFDVIDILTERSKGFAFVIK